MTFDDWYGVDIKLRGSPRPIAKAAWEAGLAEGIRREQEARQRLAPEHVEALRELLVETDDGPACPNRYAAAVEAALAALGEDGK